ncbi:MAG: bifunctional glutamate N-acetyltransferase/amino-acid acetyltransferase ArgJ [Nitrospirae bacterium]|nr:bifunctional glutamate N-acetyltransferase/amino-acid acetyltransferase ArgJ [Nitrospirota bacterium]
MKELSGGITAVPGFLASGIYAGIKKIEKKDLALIFSERPCIAAGLFTKNEIKGAPVLISERNIEKGVGQAIVANSGNSNVCTGKQGVKDAEEMAAITARALNIKSNLVYVASTGVIGEPLPMEKIRKGISDAALSLRRDGGRDAAEAIMTTDTFLKEKAVQINVGSKTITIGGIAKGSGMIYPNLVPVGSKQGMATMLSFIATDAKIASKDLKSALRIAVDKSFNMTTVDGDTSTSDMVICLANGMSGVSITKGKGYKIFQEGLSYVCKELAKMIVKDGEGATKFVEIRVKGAKSFNDAKKIGMAIANSNLVKTALFASDANWGRIMCAIGYSGIKVNVGKIDVLFNNVKMVGKGIGLGEDAEKEAAEVLNQKEFAITVDLRLGMAEATVWTCDFSYDYVKINAAYRT